MSQDDNNNSWNEHQKLILFRLDELQKGIERLEERVCQLHTDVSGLKIKAGIGAGLVSILVTVGMRYIIK